MARDSHGVNDFIIDKTSPTSFRYSDLHVRVRYICFSGSDYAIFAVKLYAAIASVLIATARRVGIWLVLVPLGVQLTFEWLTFIILDSFVVVCLLQP